MENNRGSKAKNFLQKMYHFRVKVNKQDKAIANVSSIFALACLIFAPHMTVVGVVASLLMGYQIRFESEDMDDTEEADEDEEQDETESLDDSGEAVENDGLSEYEAGEESFSMAM